EVRAGVKPTLVEADPNGSRRIYFESAASIEADEVLVATGRTLDGASLGLDAAGIEWSPRGIKVDGTLLTTTPWAWAAGDVVGGAARAAMVGCLVVAETAGDMIHEAAVMIAGGVPVGVAARMMHAYPTLSELMRSAFSDAAGA